MTTYSIMPVDLANAVQGYAAGMQTWEGNLLAGAENLAAQAWAAATSPFVQATQNLSTAAQSAASAPANTISAASKAEQQFFLDANTAINNASNAATQQQDNFRNTLIIGGIIVLAALFLFTDMGKATTKVGVKLTGSTADLAKAAPSVLTLLGA